MAERGRSAPQRAGQVSQASSPASSSDVSSRKRGGTPLELAAALPWSTPAFDKEASTKVSTKVAAFQEKESPTSYAPDIHWKIGPSFQPHEVDSPPKLRLPFRHLCSIGSRVLKSGSACSR